MVLTAEEFYANPERERSPELDFGVHWRGEYSFPTYRLSWIEATGEVYLRTGNEVTILGMVKDDLTLEELHRENRPYSHLKIEKVLTGWQIECGNPNSIQWIKNRLHSWRVFRHT